LKAQKKLIYYNVAILSARTSKRSSGISCHNLEKAKPI